jgi:hypothetical protein
MGVAYGLGKKKGRKKMKEGITSYGKSRQEIRMIQSDEQGGAKKSVHKLAYGPPRLLSRDNKLFVGVIGG